MREPEYVQTVVIGGGQAGLAVGYHLRQRRLPFVILEAHRRVGDSWRQRWDSLKLFSPARFNGLPGYPWSEPPETSTSKDEMADYLERYAKVFALPVQTGVQVRRLTRTGDRYLVDTGDRWYQADQVVVAMSNFQVPRTPMFANRIEQGITQLHASEYRNPGQLRAGGTLVVGAGNSGAEIALEVVRFGPTWLAGPDVGQVPLGRFSPRVRLALTAAIRFIGHYVLSVDTPIGRRARPRLLHRAAPLIRVDRGRLAQAGVKFLPRVVGVRGGKPVLMNDETVSPRTIIWCTGYDAGFQWIDLPIFDEAGQPRHRSGVVQDEPGLHFVGLQFLHAMTSALVNGVGRDADRIAGEIERRVRPRWARHLAGRREELVAIR